MNYFDEIKDKLHEIGDIANRAKETHETLTIEELDSAIADLTLVMIDMVDLMEKIARKS